MEAGRPYDQQDSAVADAANANSLATKVRDSYIEMQGQGRDADGWYQAVYQHHSNRFSHDNNRIWQTAALMVPLSLSTIAIAVSLDDPSLSQLLGFAIGSIILYVAWLVIAENHRSFQQASQSWLNAIQAGILGLEVGQAKEARRHGFWNQLNYVVVTWMPVQRARWYLLAIMVVVWAWILINFV